MYLPPHITYSLSDDNITFTIHYSYPSVENFSETFKYVLNGNSLTIKGFSNPFSFTAEARSDVHFTKIEDVFESVEDGIYSGTFTVRYSNFSQSGTTTLELKDGKFTCTGNSNRIPAGGSGN